MGFRIEDGVLTEYTKEPGVTEVAIPEGVKSVGDNAFRFCTSLTGITIPEGVTTIGECAFVYCESLTSITIPESVTSIGNSAFWGCTSLTSITIPESVTSIENSAFWGCTGLTSIDVSPNNSEYKSIDGVLFDKSCETLILCPEGKSGKYCIPESVTNIGWHAFDHCKKLKIDFKELQFQWDCGKVNCYSEDGYKMLKEKDFSVRLDHDIKYPLILDFYSQTKDPDAGAYIKKNGSKFLQYITDAETLSMLLENKLLSAATFNKFLISALDNNKKLFDFFITNGQDANAIALLTKNCKVLLKHIIDVQNMDALDHLLDLGCVTKKNIDEFIKYAIDNQKYEPQIVLTRYKADHFGFANLEEDFDKEFSLD